MKILVVDDEPMIRRALRQALIKRGFETDQAGSALEALRSFPLQNYDLVIIDMDMPVISGLELLRIMECQGIGGPVIILTAQSPLHSPEERTLSRPHRLLSKERSLQNIVQEIESFLFQVYQTI